MTDDIPSPGDKPEKKDFLTEIFGGGPVRADFEIGGITVNLVQANVFDIEADAVVVPHFKDKPAEGGVAREFIKKYGPSNQQAYKAILNKFQLSSIVFSGDYISGNFRKMGLASN